MDIKQQAITEYLTQGVGYRQLAAKYDAMPRNSLSDCKKQFKNTKDEAAGFKFCECIHNNGNPLNEYLEEFKNAKK